MNCAANWSPERVRTTAVRTAATAGPLRNSAARRMAKTIYNGFLSYFADFQNITMGAKARFEKADWHGYKVPTRAGSSSIKARCG